MVSKVVGKVRLIHYTENILKIISILYYMENKTSALELYNNYNAKRFLLTSVPRIQYTMGLGRKPAKYWIILRNWDKLLKKMIKFEEVYIYKKEKKYYYSTG